MVTYIITRVTDRDGGICTNRQYTKRIGRRVSFFRPPVIGRALLADYRPDTGDTYAGLLRTSHVADIMPVSDGFMVKTADSVYDFRLAAGQVSMLDRIAE